MTDPTIVMIALGATIAISAGLIAYAMTTEKDFTMMGGSLFLILSIMTFISFINFFTRVPFLESLYCGLGALVAGFSLIYDV